MDNDCHTKNRNNCSNTKAIGYFVLLCMASQNLSKEELQYMDLNYKKCQFMGDKAYYGYSCLLLNSRS